ncbi:MAG: DNA methyltransferase, partial [Candidatus Bathyarchaeia archaeon]
MGRNKAIELVYRGKKEEREILTKVESASFREVKRFGVSLDDSYNMLIFGDNLPVLKALIDEPDIRGNVRLVY